MNKNKIISSTYNLILKRPFFAIAFLIITLIILNGYNPLITMGTIVIIFILMVIELIYKGKFEHSIIFFIVFIIILLYTSHLVNISNKLINTNEMFVDKEVEVFGIIGSIPEQNDNNLSFIFKPDYIKFKDEEYKSIKNDKILVYVKTNGEIPFDFSNKISIKGYLSKSSKKKYKGGFDYNFNLLQKGVSAVIYSNEKDVYVFSVNEYPYENNENKIFTSLMKSGKKARDEIVNITKSIFPEKEAGLLAGMLIGVRKGLDEELQNAFTKSGLLHIMAVSGANILFIIMPLMFLFKKLRINRFLYLILTGISVIIFVFITGFEPSVVRAAIMALVYLTGKIIFRNYDLYTGLSIACIIMLIINPFTLYNTGFILSFTAVLSLGLFYKNVDAIFSNKNKNKILGKILKHFKEAFSAVVSVQLGVMPIGAMLFNSFSLVSLINNILAGFATIGITIMGMIIVILGFFSLDIASLLSYPCYILLKYIIFIVTFSSKWDYATIKVLTPGLLAIILYYVFIIWAFKTRKSFRTVISAIFIFFTVIIIAGYSSNYINDNDSIHIINIGKGDSLFFQTHNNVNILIDGGENDGENCLIPFLMDNKIRKIDILIGTHAHSDHINGFYDLLDYYDIGLLVLPDYLNKIEDFVELIEKADKYNIPVVYINEEDSINLKDSSFTVLNPQIEFLDKEISLNNTSIVLKYNYKDFSILLTGDLEKDFESILIDEKKEIEADILKIAHHGSTTSSSDMFLKEVNPEIAVISVGENNYNHPSAEILNRLEENKIIVFRTDKNSEIIINTNGNEYTIETLY